MNPTNPIIDDPKEAILRELREESRAFLRGMTSSAYLAASTGEAFAASIVFSPVVGAFSSVNAILRTRFFQVVETPVQQ